MIGSMMSVGIPKTLRTATTCTDIGEKSMYSETPTAQRAAVITTHFPVEISLLTFSAFASVPDDWLPHFA